MVDRLTNHVRSLATRKIQRSRGEPSKNKKTNKGKSRAATNTDAPPIEAIAANPLESSDSSSNSNDTDSQDPPSGDQGSQDPETKAAQKARQVIIGTQQNAKSTLQHGTVVAHSAMGTEQESGMQVALTCHHQNGDDTTAVPLNRRYLHLDTDVAAGTAPHSPHQLLHTRHLPVVPATDAGATEESTAADGDDTTALVTQRLHPSHVLLHCQDICKTESSGVSTLTLINSYYPHSHHHCSRLAKNPLSSAKQRNVKSLISPRGLKLGTGMPPADRLSDGARVGQVPNSGVFAFCTISSSLSNRVRPSVPPGGRSRSYDALGLSKGRYLCVGTNSVSRQCMATHQLEQ